jgi:hypothetical protein
MIKLYQEYQPQKKRSRGDVPRRRDQARHMFSVGK